LVRRPIMGTKRRSESKRREEGAGKSGRSRTKKDVFERVVLDVIERERRNLQKASAVLAALSVAMGRDERDIDAGDVADVAGQIIDGVTDALDRLELRRAASSEEPQPP
jgi:hypothetical protein